MQGENDIEQLCCVLRVLGTPTEQTWPGMTSLPDYNKITFSHNPAIPLHEVVPDATSDAVDLLDQFLVYSSPKVKSCLRFFGGSDKFHVLFLSSIKC